MSLNNESNFPNESKTNASNEDVEEDASAPRTTQNTQESDALDSTFLIDENMDTQDFLTTQRLQHILQETTSQDSRSHDNVPPPTESQSNPSEAAPASSTAHQRSSYSQSHSQASSSRPPSSFQSTHSHSHLSAASTPSTSSRGRGRGRGLHVSTTDSPAVSSRLLGIGMRSPQSPQHAIIPTVPVLDERDESESPIYSDMSELRGVPRRPVLGETVSSPPILSPPVPSTTSRGDIRSPAVPSSPPTGINLEVRIDRTSTLRSSTQSPPPLTASHQSAPTPPASSPLASASLKVYASTPPVTSSGVSQKRTTGSADTKRKKAALAANKHLDNLRAIDAGPRGRSLSATPPDRHTRSRSRSGDGPRRRRARGKNVRFFCGARDFKVFALPFP